MVEEIERLVAQRQWQAAGTLAAKEIEAGALGGPDALTLLQLAARCARELGDVDTARHFAQQGLALAIRVDSPAAIAVMHESCGLVEERANRFRSARAHYRAAERISRAHEAAEALGAVLNNHASMLISAGLEGAEPLLREALALNTEGTAGWAIAADNLGTELARQTRYAEAEELTARAVAVFRELDSAFDLSRALGNLADRLRQLGRRDAAEAAYTEAHDVMVEACAAQIDEAHYARYAENCREIEAHSEEIFRDEGGALGIGVHAMLGEELKERGFEALEAGRIGEAVAALQESREHWVKLEAWHVLVSVDYHLACALGDAGAFHDAVPLLLRVRELAYRLGDAWRESMALSGLLRLRNTGGIYDPLNVLASTLALDPIVARQRGLEGAPRNALDGGVLASLAGNLCGDNGAFGLAEAYYRESIEVVRSQSGLELRLLMRLANLHRLLLLREDRDGAAEAAAEIAEVGQRCDDPRGTLLARDIACSRAFEEGQRDPALLDDLLAACQSWEATRAQAQGATDLSGLAEMFGSPYDRAAEVALACGRPELALALTDRGRAQSLLDAIRPVADSSSAASTDPVPAVPDLGDPNSVGLELFNGTEELALLVLDAATGVVTTEGLLPSDDVLELLAHLQLFTIAADDEVSAGRTHPEAALDVLLAGSAFARISERLARAVPDGRRGVLCAHGPLALAPFDLAPAVLARTGMTSWAIAPSLNVVGALGARHGQPASGAVVGGDPLGDLPFAAAEALLVGGTGAEVAVGPTCTGSWLRRACAAGDVGVVHLACHGRFDVSHPDRSGLILLADDEPGDRAEAEADEDGRDEPLARLFTLDEIESLPLDGAVVLLSACSSGLAGVRRGDEALGIVASVLRAGARSVIAARWPVPDLSAMLLMVRLHELARDTHDLAASLDLARSDLRNLDAGGLIRRGFELARDLAAMPAGDRLSVDVASTCLRVGLDTAGSPLLGALEDLVAVDASGAPRHRVDLAALELLRPPSDAALDARPFAHPRHWGAFALTGWAPQPNP